jgi:hypothetical protein
MKIFPAIRVIACLVASSPAFAHGGGSGGMGHSMGVAAPAQMTTRQTIVAPARAAARGMSGQKAERGFERNGAVMRRIARLETVKASLESRLRWGAGAKTEKDLIELKRVSQEITRLQVRSGESIATKAAT